ncbi:hypothetical protein RhiXN_07843 [Rhizoctonia solani]|uniref:Uncharacterized protein n=2 Tax=Rhizoctonia solani TaxID=456999 RepID=A0A8H8P1W2_9AGAM|nr:uncharacterized protein RhiXN_07843 [Rhizoctonia solani]QRW22807.1 hypothetical protein RhiXN_07843 [Rhizoctonia solani]
MPSLAIRCQFTSSLSSLKAKLTTCKKTVARFRIRTSSSSDNRRSIEGERRHVQGLGYIKADVSPRRSRKAAAEAKYGNRTTSNEIVRASDIVSGLLFSVLLEPIQFRSQTTVDGFAYDRLEADSIGIHVVPLPTYPLQ